MEPYRERQRSIDLIDAAWRARMAGSLDIHDRSGDSTPVSSSPDDIEKSSMSNTDTATPYGSSIVGLDPDMTARKLEMAAKEAREVGTDSSTSTSPDRKLEQPSIPPPASVSGIREIAFIINVCMAQLLSLAALAQTVAPLLIIGDYFQVENPGQLSWFTAAYSMTLGTFILPAGRIGDMYGHKRIFIIGWMWFAIWSLIAGFSYTSGPIMFSICRAFQGIGPALLVPNAMALIGRTFPMGMRRNVVFSLFGACGPTGWVVGAVFSALLSQLTWWPWAFWALAIACAVVAGLSFIIIPDERIPKPTGPPQKPCQRFDIAGCFTGVTGLILINFALNQAPLVGWDRPYVYILFISGFIFFFGFLYQELRVAPQPLIPLRGLNKDAAFTLACIAASWGSHGIWIYYLYLFIERIRGHSALIAAAQTSPVFITGSIAALSVGFLLKKVKVAYVMFLAMAFFLIGTVLLAFAPVGQTYWLQTFLSVLIMPGGMNLSFPAGTILLSNALPRQHQGIAASLVSTMVNYSIATGLGFAGTIERHVNKDGSRVLEGYRGTWYFGIGLDVLGLALAGYFIWKTRAVK